jgi:hypothetical protein
LAEITLEVSGRKANQIEASCLCFEVLTFGEKGDIGQEDQGYSGT